jgi:hypothetical protein
MGMRILQVEAEFGIQYLDLISELSGEMDCHIQFDGGPGIKPCSSFAALHHRCFERGM